MTDELELLLEEQEGEEEEESARVLDTPKTLPVKVQQGLPGPWEETGGSGQAPAWPEEKSTGSSGSTDTAPLLSNRIGWEEQEKDAGRGKTAPERPDAGKILEQPETAALEPLRMAGAVAGYPAMERGSGGAAERLYLTLTRSRRAAAYRGRESAGGVRLVREKGWESNRSSLDARTVDRQFQKDARRYDGGFTWQ